MIPDRTDDQNCLPLPELQDGNERLYYSMGEATAIFGLPASTLRFWEKEFDMLKPRKNKKGDRFFSKNDMDIIRTIYYLTKIKGYTLQGAKDALKRDMIREADNAAIVTSLLKVKEMLLKIKEGLD